MAAASTPKKKANAPLVSVSVDYPELTMEGNRISKKGTKVNMGFARWVAKMKTLGLSQRQIMWELYVVQGKSMDAAATAMGVTRQRVSQLYKEAQLDIASKAPRSEADFIAKREEMTSRLLSVLEDASISKHDPRMLMVRLKAVDQISTLYGLNIGKDSAQSDEKPYATPEEIVALVESHALERHGRLKDVQEAREALAERDVSPEPKE